MNKSEDTRSFAVTDVTFATNLCAKHCSSLCSTSINNITIHPENLILNEINNITTTAVSKIVTILENLQTSTYIQSTADIPDVVTEQSYFTSKTTLEPTEESWNNTFNMTDMFNITDIKAVFEDYLTYILNSFEIDNNTIGEFDSTINENHSTTTEYFESFKSTIFSTFFNTTDTTTESRFDQELYSLFDDITSSASTLKDSVENVTSTIISTALVPKNKEYSYDQCFKSCKDTIFQETYSTTTTTVIPINISSFPYVNQTKLRTLCWETMFGQELIKLTVMDLIMTVVSTLAIDFFRGIFVRVMNRYQ